MSEINGATSSQDLTPRVAAKLDVGVTRSYSSNSYLDPFPGPADWQDTPIRENLRPLIDKSAMNLEHRRASNPSCHPQQKSNFPPQTSTTSLMRSPPDCHSTTSSLTETQPAYSGPVSRIHTSFRQFACVNGRIYAQAPNVMCIAKDFTIALPSTLYSLHSLILQLKAFKRSRLLLAPFMRAFNDAQIPDDQQQQTLSVIARTGAATNSVNLRFGRLRRIIVDRSILCPFGTISRRSREKLQRDEEEPGLEAGRAQKRQKIGVNLQDTDFEPPTKDSQVTLLEYWQRRNNRNYASRTAEELSAILQVEVFLSSDGSTKRDLILTFPADQVWVVETPQNREFLPSMLKAPEGQQTVSGNGKGVKTEERKMELPICLRRFVSADEGWSLLNVDYEQMEVGELLLYRRCKLLLSGFSLQLRLVAHFSNDPELVKAFTNKIDPFITIASKWIPTVSLKFCVGVVK